jgi:hypothetical protein
MARPRQFLVAGCGMVAVLMALTAGAWFAPGLWNASGAGAGLLRSAGWLISSDAGWWTLAAAGYGIGALTYRGPRAKPVRAAGRATGCAVVAGVATVLSAAWAATLSRASAAEYDTSLIATSAAQLVVAGGVFVISAVVAASRLRSLPLVRYAGARH